VKVLRLSSNKLRLLLQSGLNDLPALEILHLDVNDLVSLPSYLLRHMPVLKELVVHNNSLEYLPFLNQSPRLVEIGANHNRIR
jgi:Leucine-rich repeat (LRR) protein